MVWDIIINKLWCSFVSGDENGSMSTTIPDKPVELKNFIKFCDQRRKYPVLFKLEFQVSLQIPI